MKFLDNGFLNSALKALGTNGEMSNKKIITNLKNMTCVDTQDNFGIEKPGNQFCLTVAGNIILPIMYLYANKTNSKELQRKIKDICLDFPPLGNNHITNFMIAHLDPVCRKLINSRYIYQQGLMNIYYRFCNYRLCDLCIADKAKMIVNL